MNKKKKKIKAKYTNEKIKKNSKHNIIHEPKVN